jgi:hypothetical protein
MTHRLLVWPLYLNLSQLNQSLLSHHISLTSITLIHVYACLCLSFQGHVLFRFPILKQCTYFLSLPSVRCTLFERNEIYIVLQLCLFSGFLSFGPSRVLEPHTENISHLKYITSNSGPWFEIFLLDIVLFPKHKFGGKVK